ncbi:MAG TPA: hypothetical protein VN087_11975 [Verrucomicrobiae bacterium]|jgi:hypothetical protein|nr:hypothetical protein [Verrucomicrobiae bacterium]
MIVTIQQRWSSEYEIETASCLYSAIAQEKFSSFSGQIKLFAPRDRLVRSIFGPEERPFGASWEPS